MLEQRLLAAKPAIERWFQLEWLTKSAPLYSSVDVRNAGFKLAQVDTNLFPGGWNNLTTDMWPLAAQALQRGLQAISPTPQRVLIVPENHTRNTFYLSNVWRLLRLFTLAGVQVRVGSVNPEVTQATELVLPGGELLLLEPVVRQADRLGLADFDPDLIVLNTDLSAGVPPVLSNLSQMVVPPLRAGWHVRRKHQHFQKYDEVCDRFGHWLGLDPWLINPLFSHCDDIDFADGTGLEALQNEVDALLTRIRCKYIAHGVDEKPFVIIKADNGTYGMGIMTVRDASDLTHLNRKTRNKMATIKDGQTVSEVLIQEGVPTRERVHQATAEPVVYLMNGEVVGGFYRTHAERGIDENLNAPGATFAPLRLTSDAQLPDSFYANGVLARLATLAASHELSADATDGTVPSCSFAMDAAWAMPLCTPPSMAMSCSP
ncbi:MAG: glutamate--cysteine ligase [Limnohabitans sp.]